MNLNIKRWLFFNSGIIFCLGAGFLVTILIEDKIDNTKFIGMTFTVISLTLTAIAFFIEWFSLSKKLNGN
jgi:hypothetical protein